jgi:Glyoxalase-like domain
VADVEVGFVTFDCADPLALSTFYARLLGWRPDPEPAPNNFYAELENPHGGIGISFQRVEGYRPPEWPGQVVPQQLHLSLLATDVDTAERLALGLGARLLSDGGDLRVYADPAGHPFCISRGGG